MTRGWKVNDGRIADSHNAEGHIAEGHIDDEQFAGLLAGAPSPAASRHISECATCRYEWQQASRSLASFRDELEALASRPPVAAHAQVAARRPLYLRTAAALALGLMLAAGILLGRPARAPRSPERPAAAADNGDATLMMVDQELSSDVPEALLPAAYLAEQRESLTNSAAKRQ